MKKIEVILLVLTMCFSVSHAVAQNNSPGKHINFDHAWKFHLGHAQNPEKDFNYGLSSLFAKTGEARGTCIDVNFDDSEWEDVTLPHDWAVSLPFVNRANGDLKSHGYKAIGSLYPEKSIGWYRKTFAIAKADSGKRFVLQFDGVFRDCKVWMNGFYIGNNMSGYIGFSCDITDYVNFNGENIVVVRVDASQNEGWWYEGAGIYRHVWLNQYDNIHFVPNGIFVSTNLLDSTHSEVYIESTLENKNLNSSYCSLLSYIIDREGKRLGEAEESGILLATNESKTVKQKIKLTNARLWNLNDPYMYRVISVIKSSDQTKDKTKTSFGVRSIKIDSEKGFFLNGKNIKIKGVCCHQDHAGVGIALPDYLQYYRISLLKEMGANAYRSSHNPPSPELLNVCDSLGILVLDETRQLNSSLEYLGQLDRLILRDRNHPSIFMWSLGNEEEVIQSNSIGKRVVQTMLLRQKELDPTRTSTCAVNLGNVFTGVNEIIPVRGLNYNLTGIDEYHRNHPDQPIIGTEVGSTVTTRGIYSKDTVKCYLTDFDENYPPWASTAEQWWQLAAERSWFMGGFVWTGFDYRGEPTPFQWPNINSHFGIMDVCGYPKNIFFYYQSWWTNKDVLHIAPHWNWKGKEGNPVKVWVNTNAQDVELFLNGKSLGKKVMPLNGHLEWMVLYEPGILEAIANKNGRVLKTKVETTGTPEQIILTPSKTELMPNGADITVIDVTVQDSLGREVPDANSLIQFSVQGDAKIIGVGNGDPSSHEPDQFADGNCQRHLFNGKCQLILQAGNSGGTVKIEAKADRLKTGVVMIKIF
ncbi:MAG TPA: beta-galactosidase GalA [Bacteroidales bacterium]